MDERNLDLLKKLLFDNALGNIESAPHTNKQRRWRHKKKDQHHHTQLSHHHLPVEHFSESRPYSSDIIENFENDVTMDNRIFDDNMVLHDSSMNDTHADDTRAGTTFNNDTYAHDYIFNDKDYNYGYDFNPNLAHQAKVLQTRQQNDDEHVSIELNGINVSHVQRDASLNQTARALVRAGYCEMASFNDLRPGEFDILLSYLSYIHGLHPTTTLANSQVIKNSLQQMEQDIKKQTSNQSSKRNTTAVQRVHGAHDDDEV